MAYEDHKHEAEEIIIKVKRYRIDGIPVCASWYGQTDQIQAVEVCRFLHSKNFGCQRACMATGLHVFEMYQDLQDFATPCQGCPIWDYEKEVQPVIDSMMQKISKSKQE